MALFPNSLDLLIDRLEGSIPYVNPGFDWGMVIERHDWRPVWDLCKEIQAEFKGFKGYKTRDEHQAAWDRFQTLRKRASKLADIEKEKFANQSARLRDRILPEARGARYSMSTDFFVGAVLGHTTIEELQQMQSRLKEAGRVLSENKALMTREDKESCFEAIKEARESHDRFYEKYKLMKAERREATQRRNEEFERKQSEWRDRVQANISRNMANLQKARGALNRAQDRIREIEGKIYESDSAKWQGIFGEWLSEARAKESDIEASIEQIEGWIREDESKLIGR